MQAIEVASRRWAFSLSAASQSSLVACQRQWATCRVSNKHASRLHASMGASTGPGAQEWRSLAMPRRELCLAFTLPTGQSFRWRKTGDDLYTGVVHQRVVQVRQQEDDAEYRVLARSEAAAASDDGDVLRDYFNAGTRLGELAQTWASKDPRFCSVHPYFPGARVLRQDPVECLFQFVCSSNNHISRIHGMVERLCKAYGTPLHITDKAAAASLPEDLVFFAFPSLQQLQEATDDNLRAEGFGYRAKFIVGSVKLLMEKEGGGAAWLQGLRQVPYLEASEALCSLPGVGPKVAACVCLFSLDKHAAIPVDTHVWQLAARYYTPHLKGKTLTKQLMVAVETALQDRFGSHAGWAHNTLFISELASQRHVLPAHLHPGYRGRAPKKAKGPDEDEGADLEGPVTPPQQLGRGQRSAVRSAGAKRRAAVPSSVKQEPEEDDTKDEACLSQGGAGSESQPRAEHPERSESASEPRREVQGKTTTVSEIVEGAAMEAFAEVRQIDAGAMAEVADAVQNQRADGAGSSDRRARKVARNMAQQQSVDART